MTNLCRRSISLVLALILVFGTVPVNAMASETEETVQETVETTAPAETIQAPETEPAETEPETTGPEVTQPPETVPPETQPDTLEATQEPAAAAVPDLETLQIAVDEAAEAGKASVHIQYDLTVTESGKLTVPAGVTLYFDHAVLTVADGAELTLMGESYLDENYDWHYGQIEFMDQSQLIVEGTLDCRARVAVMDSAVAVAEGASMTIREENHLILDDAQMDLYGDMEVRGSLYIGYSYSCGRFHVEAGELNLYGTLVNRGLVEVGGTYDRENRYGAALPPYSHMNIHAGGRYEIEAAEGPGISQTPVYGFLTVYSGGKLVHRKSDEGGILVYGTLTVENYEQDVTLNGVLIRMMGGTLTGMPSSVCTGRSYISDQEELLAFLAQIEDAPYGYLEIWASCDLTLTESRTIPKGTKLYLSRYMDPQTNQYVPSILTVEEGTTLSVGGELILEAGGAGSVRGDLVIFPGAKAVVSLHDEWYGTTSALTVEKTGSVLVEGSFRINSLGAVALEGTMQNNGTIQNSGTFTITGTLGNAGAWEGTKPVLEGDGKLVEGTLEDVLPDELEELLKSPDADGWVRLKKTITLTRSVTVTNDLEICGGELIVPSGKTLTVAEDVSLYLLDGGKLEVQQGGRLVNKGYIRQTEHAGDGYLRVEGSYSNSGIIWADVGEDVADIRVFGIQHKDLGLSFDNAGQERVKLAAQVTGFARMTATTWGFVLDGDLTIPANMDLWVQPVVSWSPPDAAGLLVIPENSTVTVNGTLAINCGDDGELATVRNEGTILLNETGDLWNRGRYTGKLPVLKGGKMHPEPEVVSLDIREGDVEVSKRTEQIPLTVDAQAIGENYVDVIPAITWTSDDQNVVDASRIRDNGDGSYSVFVKGTGTATVTAAASYGNRKSDTVTVTVTPVYPTSLTLYVEEAEVESLTLPKSEAVQSFVIALAARDQEGEIPLRPEEVKWTSSDTDLAKVEVLENGGARVTVKASSSGAAVLTASVQGISASMTLRVVDFDPRLDGSSVTLDAMSGKAASVSLVQSSGNAITQVCFADTSLNAILEARYHPERNSLCLKVRGDLQKMPANGTYKTKLVVKTERAEEKAYPFTVILKSVLPSVTIKQPKNLKWTGIYSGTELLTTVKAGKIRDVKILSQDFQGVYDPDGQTVRLEYTQDYIQRALEAARPGYALKPEVKVTLRLDVEGYQYPVEKTLSLKLDSGKNTLVTNPASSVINENLGETVIRFSLSEKGEAWPLDLHGADILFEEEPADWWLGDLGDQLFVRYETAGKRTQTLYVRLADQLQYAKVTHKVTVSGKLPSVKLGSSTITIQTPVDHDGHTAAVLDQTNLELGGFSRFVSTAKEGSAAWKEARKIRLEYDGYGKLNAWFEDTDALPKAGTYTFKAIPYVEAEGRQTDLKPVTVRVRVADLRPNYKLSAATLKLNRDLVGRETVFLNIISANEAARSHPLLGFAGLDAHQEDVELVFDANGPRLQATLKSGGDGKYVYALHPIVMDGRGRPVTLTKVTVKLTVQAYRGTVSVRQSPKGKLDALNPESQILYTVTKITNSAGEVAAVELAGRDGGKFALTGLGRDARGKQTFGLTMTDTQYSTRQTYKVRFRYILDTGAVYTSSEVSVKVAQGSLRVKPSRTTCYLSQDQFLAKLEFTAPENVQIRSVTLNRAKTHRDLLKALREDGDLLYLRGPMYAWIRASIQNPASLQAGKTYKLVLDVVPEGQTMEGKATQVTLNIRVAK